MAKGKTRSQALDGTSVEVGYEAQLWQMADALRGSMDAAKYSYTTWRLAKVNLAVRGIDPQIGHCER